MQATCIQIHLDYPRDANFVYYLLSARGDHHHIDVIHRVDIHLSCKHLHKCPRHLQQGYLSEAAADKRPFARAILEKVPNQEEASF